MAVKLSNNDRAFIKAALVDSVAKGSIGRLDGRELLATRPCKLTFGTDRGHVQVTQGGTSVLAQVTCEPVAPQPERPTEGFLRYSVEASPMASASIEPNRVSPLSMELTRMLEQTLRDSRAVDSESLCIQAGDKVWQVRVDVTIIDHDGCLADAVVTAAIAALMHFRRPFVSMSGEAATIHSVDDHEPVPLAVYHQPICSTFAFFCDGSIVIADPTAKEEEVAEGRLTVAVNSHQEVCLVRKTGAVALSPEQMLQCVKLAGEHAHSRNELIKQAIAEEEENRRAGVWTRKELKKKVSANTQGGSAVNVAERTPADSEEDEGSPAKPAKRGGKVSIEAVAPGAASLFEGEDAWSADDDEGNGSRKAKRPKQGKSKA
eukprot:m.102094 g.102094  ORF g.102094 m.102094 type:complete len:375 (-) comp15678_c2_seq3:256-1380(-)